MISKMMTKIIAIGLLILMLISVVPFAKKAHAEQLPTYFGGYYEEIGDSLTIDTSTYVTGNVTNVKLIGGDLEEELVLDLTCYEREDTSITIKKLNEKGLTLGETYSLVVNNVAFEIMYVTKALRQHQDIRVLDIDVEEYSSDEKKIIEGYYVLANDIVVPDGEENKHDGIHHLALWGPGKTEAELYYSMAHWIDRGFKGTFDGRGHNITYSSDFRGLFGHLLEGAVIKNTGFVNVNFKDRVVQAGASFLAAVMYCKNEPILIKDCYFQTEKGSVCAGLTWRGEPNWQTMLKCENLIFDIEGKLNEGFYGGILQTYNLTSDTQKLNSVYKDIYAVSKLPLSYYGSRHFYASNSNVVRPEDATTFIKISTIKSYDSYGYMIKDTGNDYSTFNKQYWDFTYGIPMWKTYVKDEYSVEIDTLGNKTNTSFTLTLGGIDKAQAHLSFYGIAIDGATISYELLSKSGSYTYDMDSITVSSTGEIKVVKVGPNGKAKLKLTFNYEGKEYVKEYTVYTKTNTPTSPSQPENPQYPEDDKGMGCGSVSFDHTDFTGGAMMILGAFVFMMVRRNKKKNSVKK